MASDGPVILTAFCPPVCEHGHVLRYGGRKDARFLPNRVTVSFATCDCPAARAKPGASGHIAVLCRRCEDAGVETLFYDPPHVPG